jgi:hypothetical protein
MPFALLLAMQAAGMVVDYWGMKEQQRYSRMGQKIQQAGMEANIYATRAETEDASLQAMQELRKNLGSQIAVFAARGTSTSGGSAMSIFNESISNFSADERTRRLNQLVRENEIRAGNTISSLNSSANKSKMWQGFAGRTINRFPSTTEGWKKGINEFKSSFGLTPVGA